MVATETNDVIAQWQEIYLIRQAAAAHAALMPSQRYRRGFLCCLHVLLVMVIIISELCVFFLGGTVK